MAISAGYSGKPLAAKLGLAAGVAFGVDGAPPSFAASIAPLPAGVRPRALLDSDGPFGVIVVFVLTRSELAKKLPQAVSRLEPNGALWIAWPKKASGVATDVTEDRVREVALPRGLVDNKVCAIDSVWSGLRLVIRLENRPKQSGIPRKKVGGAKRSTPRNLRKPG